MIETPQEDVERREARWLRNAEIVLTTYPKELRKILLRDLLLRRKNLGQKLSVEGEELIRNG